MASAGKSRNDLIKDRMGQIARHHDDGSGRTVEELLKTKEVLKGYESQRLRLHCTTNCMEPRRDLDDYGKMLMLGDLDSVKSDFSLRLYSKKVDNLGMTEEEAEVAVVQDLFALHWGPTGVPLYNLLGLFTLIYPPNRRNYLNIAEFYINTAKVPINGVDHSGTTALSQSFSTKPSLDLEYAQMLYDAGGDVNNRNRYGTIVAHEIVQVYDFRDPAVLKKSTAALEWFLRHGGNVDIQDGDGMSPRAMIERMRRIIPSLAALVDKEDKRRQAVKDKACALCAREAGVTVKLLSCGKCKKVKYCDPKVRACQKLHWPLHKKVCKA